jgi:hypothetical protein
LDRNAHKGEQVEGNSAEGCLAPDRHDQNVLRLLNANRPEILEQYAQSVLRVVYKNRLPQDCHYLNR